MADCRGCPYYLDNNENELDKEQKKGPDWGMCALNAVPSDRSTLKGCPFENFGPADPED